MLRRCIYFGIALNSLAFPVAVVLGLHRSLVAQGVLMLLPAALAFFIYQAVRGPAQSARGPVRLLLAALAAEYLFWMHFGVFGRAWQVLYLLMAEGMRAALFVAVLNLCRENGYRTRLTRLAFLPAAGNLFVWLFFSVSPFGVWLGPWLESPFTSGAAGLRLAATQLAVYDRLRARPKQPREKFSYATVERMAAWVAYCISGYREPGKSNSGKGGDTGTPGTTSIAAKDREAG